MKRTMFAISFLMAFAAGTVKAAPIFGGLTTVEVTADLTSLGLGGAPFGSATVSGAVFSFPITGGSATSGDLEILHDGSGVTLFTLDPLDATEVTVGNFVIDTAAATVFGDVIGGPTDLDLFSFGAATGGIGLDITETLAGALTINFGAPDLTGAQFGIANTAPEVVPLPASAVLLLAGLAGLGALRRVKPS